ncbi:MAG: universal stress protein [Sedimentitalea sp.]|nr:universal stress protein [Sedimentitalea sp.]
MPRSTMQYSAWVPISSVLGTHARSWLSRALLGSTAEEMLSDPPCDVLVTPLRKPNNVTARCPTPCALPCRSRQ